MDWNEELALQVEAAAGGDPWHGESFSALLEGLDAKAAAAKPIATTHSIWELVLHVISIQQLVLDRCGGQKAPFVEDESWPLPDPSAEDRWEDARLAVIAGEAKIAAAARAFDEARLDAPIAEGSDRGVDLLLGHLQHNLYHMGQIGLLKKALGLC